MRVVVLLLALLVASAAVAQDAPGEVASPPEAASVDAIASDRDAAMQAARWWRGQGALHLAEQAVEVALAAGGGPAVRIDLAEVAIAQRRPHGARWILSNIDTADDPELAERVKQLTESLPKAPKRRGLKAAYALRDAGEYDEAEWALRGTEGTVPEQQRALELGYLAVAQQRVPRAKAFFALAASGEDEAIAETAAKELAVQPMMVAAEQLDTARSLRVDGLYVEAEALLMALLPVESPQLVALELAYVSLEADQPAKGRVWLQRAMEGDDDAVAEAARTQYESMPDLVILRAMEAGWKLKDAGQCDLALEAFEAALVAGGDEQLVQLEIGYSQLCAGRPAAAKEPLQIAAAGTDAEVAQVAAELLSTLDERIARQYLVDAGNERQAKDFDQAAISLDMAEAAGANPCSVFLERGYLALAQDKPAASRGWFIKARSCDDEAVSQSAAAELKASWRLFWGDIYAELYGWHRFYPAASRNTNLVPMLRVRGYIHPLPKLDLDPYVFFQISRDVASRGSGPNGYPLVYADNTVLFGVGVLFRFWKRQVGLFAQIGPAINLLNDQRRRVWLDARAGGFFSIEAPGCRPEPEDAGARVGFEGCGDVYAEAVWVSRFDNNIFTMGRGRLAFTFLVTGPVAWQPVAEVRVLKDVNNDFWNNLIDAGGGIRWRLLEPIGLDVMLGVHGGSYFGLEDADPAPTPLTYAELRLQAATYIAF